MSLTVAILSLVLLLLFSLREVSNLIKMNSIARVTGFAPQISATVHCLPPSNRKAIVEFAKKAEQIIFEPRPAVNGSHRLAKAFLSPTGWVNPRSTVGLTCKLDYIVSRIFMVLICLG